MAAFALQGQSGYLWQRQHSLWSLKYLLSGPLRKKDCPNFWAKRMFIAVCPLGLNGILIYDASLVQKFTDISHLKANSLPYSQQSASEAARAQGQNKRSSPPQEWTSWPGLQDECQYIKDCHILQWFPIQGADPISHCGGDQRQAEGPLFCW